MPVSERKKKRTKKQTTVQASNGKGYVHKQAPCDAGQRSAGVAVNSKKGDIS